MQVVHVTTHPAPQGLCLCLVVWVTACCLRGGAGAALRAARRAERRSPGAHRSADLWQSRSWRLRVPPARPRLAQPEAAEAAGMMRARRSSRAGGGARRGRRARWWASCTSSASSSFCEETGLAARLLAKQCGLGLASSSSPAPPAYARARSCADHHLVGLSQADRRRQVMVRRGWRESSSQLERSRREKQLPSTPLIRSDARSAFASALPRCSHPIAARSSTLPVA